MSSKVQQLLEGALSDPELGPPKGCQYVYTAIDRSTKRCIVGTMLHQLGVDDRTLIGDNPDGKLHQSTNGKAIASRPDLQAEFLKRGYTPDDVDIIRQIQNVWDGCMIEPDAHPLTRQMAEVVEART